MDREPKEHGWEQKRRDMHDPRIVGGAALWADEITDEMPFSVSTLNLIENLQVNNPGLELRIEQLECLDAIEKSRLEGSSKALVHMATGLGKTTIVAADVKRYLDRKPGARVLFLCHQNDILAQAKERFETLLGEQYTYGSFTGESQDYHEVTCLFASFDMMRTKRDLFYEHEFDYIAVDESHHGKAETYEPTLRYFKPDFMLGVTATPDRHDLKNIREIFGSEVFRLPFEEAIARGLLANVDYHVITDSLTDVKTIRDIKGKRYGIRKLNRTVFIPKRDEEISRIINEKSASIPNLKRIIFCKSIDQAKEMTRYFEKAAPLHSKLLKKEQDARIAQFRDNELDTLITIDMFNEGIDIPEANQIIFLRSTQSRTVFLQQLGRGLRRTANKNSVQVLDFVANCDRLSMLDSVWREIERQVAVRNPSGVPSELINIDVGEIHFGEAARLILEILADIETTARENTGLRPPEGYMSARAIRKLLKISDTTLASLNERLKLVPEQYYYPPLRRPIYYYTSEQAESIIEQYTQIERKPDGYMSVTGIVKAHGLGIAPVEAAIEELGFKTELYRTQNGRVFGYLTPQQVDEVLARIGARQQAPDQYIKLIDVCDYLGTTRSIALNRLQKLGLDIVMYKNEKNNDERYVSPEAFSALTEFWQTSAKPIPEGYVTLPTIRSDTGLAMSTLWGIAKDVGIEFELCTNAQNIATYCVSADDCHALLSHPLAKTPVRPTGCLTQYEIMQAHNMGRERVKQTIKALGLKPQRYRHPKAGHIREYYTKEQIQQIKNYGND